MTSQLPDGPLADCAPGSLRARGWRQGCRFELELPYEIIGLGDDSRPEARRYVHPTWTIVEQDCGLAWGDASTIHEGTVEIRPILTESPPAEQGVRNAKFSLQPGAGYLYAHSPRQIVAPALLAEIAGSRHEHDGCLDDDGALALKTWLGLRYDRPAVPQVFIPAYEELSKRYRHKKHPLRDRLRDVLVQFSQAADGGVLFDLVAVLPADDDAPDEVRQALGDWLADVCLSFPTGVGTATALHVATSAEVSLELVERSYALDLTYVTWPSKGGGPVGATATKAPTDA